MRKLAIHQLAYSQWLPVPPVQAFTFFERPENLALVTPPALDFDLLTPSPVKMRRGAVIDYTIRQLGVRLRWRTLISDYRPPRLFVDEQLSGPYSLWRHEHRFSAEADGTRMLDSVTYALPNALPDRVAAWLERRYVRPQLEGIFGYRELRFRELLTADDALTVERLEHA